jgi:phosphatidylserine/phosphatidylglycerophosphate/cardiolipin synthase-like enzyme
MRRSHPSKFQFSEEQNRHLSDAIERAGGEVLLDQRVRIGGSHRQRLVVIRHTNQPALDVAFTGGIDLCHSRRDDTSDRGDPQAVRTSSRYGDQPPWQDVQLELRGPVVSALDTSFRERWTARAPLNLFDPIGWIRGKVQGADVTPVAGTTTGSGAVWTAYRAGVAHVRRRVVPLRLREGRRTQYRARLYEGGSAHRTLDLAAWAGPRLWLGGTSQSMRADAPGPGEYTCSTSKTVQAHRYRCIPRCAFSMMRGRASAATTSTDRRGHTTASCPAR